TAISESELSAAAAKADRTGLYCCPQTGVALASLMKLLDSGTIQKNEKVIVLSTANGLKFTDFKSGYHDRSLSGINIQLDNSPIEVSSDYKTLLNTVNDNIG
ncbi:MAG: threonine synthase, partial [Chloroflexi bacterium]|nr:threonine synthase [Chloroflexota bacterium]